MLRRVMGVLLGLPLTAVGALGVAAGRAPGQEAVDRGLELIEGAARALGQDAAAIENHLTGAAGFGVLAAGVVVLALGLLPRRSGDEGAERGRGAGGSSGKSDEKPMKMPGKLVRKVQKQAHAKAKAGDLVAAAEACLAADLYDQAAGYFEQAEEWVRAAEVRHDQNEFEMAAKLYVQVGQFETAATILASQGQYVPAAELYQKADKMTVAAELYEKAGEDRKAGDCYTRCEFHRHAAQAYLKAESWLDAARALEAAFDEESLRVGTGESPGKQKELRSLVRKAGKLYEEAGEPDAAVRLLERGECLVPAAEIALRREQFAKAAELFERAGEAERAAEVLRRLGEDQAAARILGEHLRERGDPVEAAEQLMAAGDFLAAGDLFRSLEEFARAGECYEREGDAAQAAEMFRIGGETLRAAENYERVGQHANAAECYAETGDDGRQASALASGGRFLEAGRIHHGAGRLDDAIKVLQQVPSESYEHGAACALLGELFVAKGQPALAVTKLAQAVGGSDVSQENVDAFYRLASVYEELDEPARAAEVFERILAFDYHHRDVEARLEATRARAASETPREAAGGAATVGAGAAKPPRYRIEGELGRGGMGIVHKAHDTVLDRPVALKVLPDAFQENPQALANFLREAKSAARLNHPNIVTVYDAGEQEGMYYIAMEYVDGTTLKAIVQKRGPIAPAGVLHVLLQMCDGLGYAHEQHIVHRDVKTANTMWTRDKKAKIMDFGLAKVIEEVRNHTTLVSGTPYYMSPEQTLGKNIDHRTDIYSLGVTIFELVTGTLPFREGNVPYHHVHTPPPDPRELNDQVPGLIAAIVNKCLQKNPDERFQATGEIAAVVRKAMAQRASA